LELAGPFSDDSITNAAKSAVEQGHEAVLQLLGTSAPDDMEYASPSMLITAAYFGHAGCLRVLMQQCRTSLALINPGGETTAGLRDDRPDVSPPPVSRNAIETARQLTTTVLIVLEEACFMGHLECVDVILASGVIRRGDLRFPEEVISHLAEHGTPPCVDQIVRRLLQYLEIPLPLPNTPNPLRDIPAPTPLPTGPFQKPCNIEDLRDLQYLAVSKVTSEGFVKRCVEQDRLGMLQMLVHDLHYDPHGGNCMLLCHAAAAGAAKVVQWLLTQPVSQSATQPQPSSSITLPQSVSTTSPADQQTGHHSPAQTAAPVAGSQQQQQQVRQYHLPSLALLHAVRGGQEEVVRVTLDAGADPDVENGECLVDTVYSEAVSGVLLVVDSNLPC
jgi:hypothetical protein